MKIEGGRILLLERVDFSGIAKGWITDRVADFLLGRGWKNFVVDSGGDMYFSGLNEKLEKWTVDIAGIPFEKLTLGFLNKAIATSGIGKRKWENGGGRFHHLINPKDPEDFSFDLKSVTVIADSVEEADVWAKTLFLMGKEKGIVYARKNSIGSIFLDYRGNAGISPAINGYKI
ncbi:MAG: thiamine biosynthesis lipoprotein [uncultured bacterium]|nr:MAG: thiamine biosynthesis lipoprotein [uncultured bacterium]